LDEVLFPRTGAYSALTGAPRSFASSSSSSSEEEESLERDVLPYDVLIVGAGPAGLAAAIRTKQIAKERDVELSVCVVEKGSEVGSHILSGNVLEPRALDELIPEWRDDASCPINQKVTKDRFVYLTSGTHWTFPLTPPQMRNHGNYVTSLSQVTRWLGEHAESLGVDVLPGFAASEVLYRRDGSVAGIATGDVGIAKDGTRKANFSRGVEVTARATLFAEGCRGSLSELVMEKFAMRGVAQAQTYALGFKEVWSVPKEKHNPGYCEHTVGYPLPSDVYGGSFLYHMGPTEGNDTLVALGFVVGLDYRDPNFNPYDAFQKWKMHPRIKSLLEDGTCLQYGARTLNEGGWQSLPEDLHFPGGAILGCSAGLLNVPKIKGTHTAMKSGMLAAEVAVSALFDAADGTAGTDEGPPANLSSYSKAVRNGWIGTELAAAANVRPAFGYLGFWGGLIHAVLDTYIIQPLNGGPSPFTIPHHTGKGGDRTSLKLAADAPTTTSTTTYDNVVSFDILTSLNRSGTNHEHNQPSHLKVNNMGAMEEVNYKLYNGPEGRYCPARVYEWVDGKLTINAQNCLHCKACAIKDVGSNIKWTTPEGGGGPSYTLM